MYQMVHIQASQEIKALPEVVWSLVADASGWQRWSPMDESGLEQPGSPEADGVGAIRRFRTGRIVSREQVIAFEGPRRLAYTLLSGLPLRDYRADVLLTPSPSGTRVEWKSQFRAKVFGTGWIYGFMLRRFLRQLLAALAAEAEKKQAIATS